MAVHGGVAGGATWDAREGCRGGAPPAPHGTAPPLACCQVAGLDHGDLVHLSFANAALGATPYLIALHRCARAARSRHPAPPLWLWLCSTDAPQRP